MNESCAYRYPCGNRCNADREWHDLDVSHDFIEEPNSLNLIGSKTGRVRFTNSLFEYLVYPTLDEALADRERDDLCPD